MSDVERATFGAEVRALLLQGATERQLGLAFGHTADTVARRLAKVTPNGQNKGRRIYLLKDAAPHLIAPPADMVDRILRMNHMDLPPALKKEYWQGRALQLGVLEKEGDLWQTTAVVRYVAAAFQEIRTEIQLMADTVERDTVLSDEQRAKVESLVEGALQGMKTRIQELFLKMVEDAAGRPTGNLLEPPVEDPAAGL